MLVFIYFPQIICLSLLAFANYYKILSALKHKSKLPKNTQKIDYIIVIFLGRQANQKEGINAIINLISNNFIFV